ncbi:tape measure protein [Pseudomonas citronellolis]|uniref:tape measure protein n=1 Tax=Pseudomonas citronellolis TaxID=53408 RepID=UPI00248D8916|nr:tape measure protein [Pseudomonas citronellolis]
MTDTSRNVELVIRAKNLSKKTLQDVRNEIEDINKALDAQIDASKRGQGSLKDLDATYRRLEDAMKSLLQQQAIIKQFEAQSARLRELQDRLGAASTKLREHQAAMEAAEKVTQRQTNTQTRLLKAVERAEQAVAAQSARLATLREQGEAAGLAMSDLSRAQDELLAVGRQLADTNASQAQASEQLVANMRSAQKAAKDLAETEAFEAAAAAAARRNAESEYSQFWLKELAKREAEERRFNEISVQMAEKAAKEKAAAEAFNTEATKAAQRNRQQQAEYEYAQLFHAADQRAAQAAAIAQLNEMADKAVAAARGYTTLGDASQRLTQNSRTLASNLRSIIDPAGSARTTLGGVEEEVKALDAAISQISGPVKGATQQLRQLADAQKALVSQASGIDAYQKQVESLRAARAGFSDARAAVLQYAQAIRQADAPTAEMQAHQRQLQGALASAAQQLQLQLARTRELREGLRSAGVDTSNLVAAQQRLVASARTATGAVQKLGAAVEKYGEETRSSANDLSLFESNGRTTLSFMQRLRGEVLALAAAYGGLQGALNLGQQSLEAFNTKQGTQNQLALAVGNDPKRIAEEYAYIREQADRIGVAFEGAAKGYAKFAAAASLAGRSNQEIRYVAETFLEVGRVANLSADDIDGVFKALEQIYSKGKIQAEELRGQLGDRLFGAFEIAAKALKDTYPDLNKAMKDGEVTSAQLVAIAEQYRKTVADQLPNAMKSLSAEQARLNSAVYDFKVLIAESGFADTYADLVQKLTTFLKSDDGKKFAQDISTAFSAVVTVLTYLLDHLDEVKLAIELAFGLKALSLVAGLATAISTKLLPALKLATTQFTIMGEKGVSSAKVIQLAFATLAAFFTGWQIGTYLSEQFAVVRQAGVALVIGLEKLFTQMKFAAEVVWVSISESAKNNFNKALNTIADFKDDTLKLFADLARQLGQEGLADKISGYISDGSRRGLTDVRGEIDKLKNKLASDLKEIDEIGFEMFLDAAKDSKAAAAQAAAASPTASPGITGGGAAGGDDKAYKKLVKQREALANELVNALAAAEAKIQKNEKLSLESRLAAIDTEYQKVYTKIDKLSKLPGGADLAKQMRSTLDGYVKQLKVQETLKFNTEQQARNEKAVNDQIELRQQLIATVEAQRQAGLISEEESVKQIDAINARIVPNIQASAQAAIDWANAHKEIFNNPGALETFLAKMQAIQAAAQKTAGAFTQLDKVIVDSIANNGVTAIEDTAKAIGQAVAGTESWGDALRDAGRAAVNFFAQLLLDIARAIIKQMILNALLAWAGANGYSGIAGAAQAAGGRVMHTGGVVGVDAPNRTRAVSPAWFAGAPRYHSGGVSGLAPDEYPAILQKGEEVLSGDDPRNVMNGGLGAGQGGADTVQPLTVNNYVDAESFMGAALAKPAGQKMIMNVLRANSSQLKALMGSR